jgi:hypothetical protein
MELASLLKELKERSCYKEFIEKHPDTFFCAGFFVISNDGDKAQLDFFLPKENKIASFEYPFSSFKIYEDEIKEAEEQKIGIAIDIKDLKEEVERILKKHDSEIKPTKIIAILKDNNWNLTCMNDALQLVRIKLNAKTKEELHFEKGNLMDIAQIRKK